ncbi:uncharacterized protein KRP23_14297 [Phytophthora ramorum]|uniref:uncharacterized protein n=1 Tax=Phytophthora ramorum TaxID=164328 RepID=UPI0030AB98D5|nr:hypothetical protein KRP23_14297 [Phytophthora ramorum]
MAVGKRSCLPRPTLAGMTSTATGVASCVAPISSPPSCSSSDESGVDDPTSEEATESSESESAPSPPAVRPCSAASLLEMARLGAFFLEDTNFRLAICAHTEPVNSCVPGALAHLDAPFFELINGVVYFRPAATASAASCAPSVRIGAL